jgi:hypothetical protein
MRRILIFSSAAFTLLMGSLAAAQGPGNAPAEPSKSNINLTVEQKHTIKEIVKDLKVQAAPANVPTSVGATVPATVALSRMPPELGQKVPQVKSHEFFIADGRIVLVSPTDKKIDEVIE